MTFRQLQTGDEFDFIGPNACLNSFFNRCTKVSARKYSWEGSTGVLETRIGTVGCEVFNVVRKQATVPIQTAPQESGSDNQRSR
jgi:hypothetical protein